MILNSNGYEDLSLVTGQEWRSEETQDQILGDETLLIFMLFSNNHLKLRAQKLKNIDISLLNLDTKIKH